MQLADDAEKAGYNVVTKSVFSTAKLEALGWRVKEGDMKSKMKKTISRCS